MNQLQFGIFDMRKNKCVFAQIRAKSLFWKSYESALEIQNELVKNHYVLISVILEAGFTNTAILLQKHPSLNA